MSLVKFLLFLTFSVVVSHAKVARPMNYDAAESNEEDRPMGELPLDMDFVAEDEKLGDTVSSVSGKTKMSDELYDVLKNANSFKEVKKFLDYQFVKRVEEDTVEKINEESISTSMKCPVPRGNSVHTTSGSGSVIRLIAPDFSWVKDSECAPYPMPVKFDHRPDGMYYPPFATLHRCAGSCGHLPPTIHQCEVIAEQEVKYGVYSISYTGASGFVEVKVMNHTRCACGCVLKSHHCDPNIMRYNQDTCRCDCINDASICNPSIQKWNDASCQCQCKYPASQCSVNKKWSTSTCACECTQSKKDACQLANKQIDPTSCSCV